MGENRQSRRTETPSQTCTSWASSSPPSAEGCCSSSLSTASSHKRYTCICCAIAPNLTCSYEVSGHAFHSYCNKARLGSLWMSPPGHFLSGDYWAWNKMLSRRSHSGRNSATILFAFFFFFLFFLFFSFFFACIISQSWPHLTVVNVEIRENEKVFNSLLDILYLASKSSQLSQAEQNRKVRLRLQLIKKVVT